MTVWINTTNRTQISAQPWADTAQIFNTATATKAALIQTSGLRVAQLARTLLTEASTPDLTTDSDIPDDDILDDGNMEDCPIVVVASLDEIGAVGLIAARHLEEWGAWVQVVLTHPPDAAPDAITEVTRALNVLVDLGVSTAWAEDGWELPPADLLIDAMQTDTSHDLIQLVNSHHAPVLSLCSPAGIDPGSGEFSAHHIIANTTLALGFPLSLLASADSASVCGDIYLADIGLKDEAYAKFGIDKSALFAGQELILLEMTGGESCAQ